MLKYLLAVGLAAAVLLPLTTQSARAADQPTGFLNATAHIAGDAKLQYVVYVPRSYTPDHPWPVVLFLHGSGERGDNGLSQSQVGIGSAIRLHPERFPCIVIMPQCPNGTGWGGAIPGFVDENASMRSLVMRALDDTIQAYHGDPDRIYLTGLSMGGFGTWDLGSKHAGKFAALLPICGGGKPEEMASILKSKPIWIFHGGADPTVPVQRSRDMYEALQKAGNTTVKFTEYPGVGHNSWDQTYNDPLAIQWLLAQKLSH